MSAPGGLSAWDAWEAAQNAQNILAPTEIDLSPPIPSAGASTLRSVLITRPALPTTRPLRLRTHWNECPLVPSYSGALVGFLAVAYPGDADGMHAEAEWGGRVCGVRSGDAKGIDCNSIPTQRRRPWRPAPHVRYLRTTELGSSRSRSDYEQRRANPVRGSSVGPSTRRM